MLVIGITGSLGSGKSTVASMFAKFGGKLIDADCLAHQQLKKGSKSFQKIIKRFGAKILTQGAIDRKKLAEIVFKDKSKLNGLNRIIHPAVIREIYDEIKLCRAKKNKGFLVVDVPLLFETGLDKSMDYSILVRAPKEVRIKRAVEKLRITKSQAIRRDSFQLPISQKIRYADIIIDNNVSKQNLRKRVKQIWQKLYQRVKN